MQKEFCTKKKFIIFVEKHIVWDYWMEKWR